MRYWKKVNADGSTKSVENYSHNLKIEGAVEIKQDEFDAFMNALPAPVSVKSALELEVESLKTRIATLEKTTASAISK